MCCGRKSVLHYPKRPGRRTTAEARARRATVPLRYTGHTGLTAFGAVTGVRYRFDGPGAVVRVDVRDRRSLLSVPSLSEWTADGS